MSSPSHIEVILTEKERVVAKADKDEADKKKVSKKKLARQKRMQQQEWIRNFSFEREWRDSSASNAMFSSVVIWRF